MKICIDPGHGGSDPGAIGNGHEEKDLTLAISLKLASALSQLGHHVIMTRHIDRTLSLYSRADFANRYNAERFLSVHYNAAGSATAQGMETFAFPGSQLGIPLAQRVQQALVNAFPNHRDRGVKEANWAVLRLTAMPAILVECEFITHPLMAAFLADEQEQSRIAQAIAAGMT